MKYFIVLAFNFLFLFSAVAGDVAIEGQVFIRTAGGDSIKLSLVDVGLFDEKIIADNLDEKRKAGEPLYEEMQPYVKAARKKEAEARAKMDADSNLLKAWSDALIETTRIRGIADYPHSALYYFKNLPEAVQTAKTDADGKFAFKAPSGSYVLVATSTRHVGDKTEFYNWMVRAKASADVKVMLANDNVSSADSPNSLIHTPDGELYIYSTAKRGGLDVITDFLEQDKHARADTHQAELEQLRSNPKAAELKAITLYPDVGVAGSPLNVEFIARLKRYRAEKAAFFIEPDWPIRLAKECSEDLMKGLK